jgi:hypothetical protein
MAPSNGVGVCARIDSGICLVARLIPETRVRVGDSESGATRAVVQRILLVSSRKPRGRVASRGLRGLCEPSSGLDGFSFDRCHCAGIGGRVQPECGQCAGHRVDPPPAFERRMQPWNVPDVRRGKVRFLRAGAGKASCTGGTRTHEAGKSEELCEHGSPPTVLPRRRASGRVRLRLAPDLSRERRACLQ